MNINERLDTILNAVKGIKPDEALSKQISDQAARIAELESNEKSLTEANATKDTRIAELETENATLKEGKETAEANATKFESELKEAKATIENPEGEIQKQVAAGVQKAISESGHPPIKTPEGNAGTEKPGAELKGIDRVAAAFKAKLSK